MKKNRLRRSYAWILVLMLVLTMGASAYAAPGSAPSENAAARSLSDAKASGSALEALTGGRYSIDGGYFYGLSLDGAPQGWTVAALKQSLGLPDQYTILVTDSDGGPCADGDPVATGYRVTLLREGQHVESGTAVVMGDIVGVGRMTLSQLVRVATAFTGKAHLVGAWYRAALLTGRDVVTLSDVDAIAGILCQATGQQPGAPGTGGGLSISGPVTVEQGETVTLRIETGSSAVYADIETLGLEIVSFSGSLSDETRLLLLHNYGGTVATYMYRVTAQPGQTVSFALRNVLESYNGADSAAPDAQLQANVVGAPVSGNMIQIIPGSPVYPQTAYGSEYLQAGWAHETGTTVGQFRQYFTVRDPGAGSEYQLKILTHEGVPAQDSAIVSTGMRVSLQRAADGMPVEEREILIYGDVLGTGLMQLAQIARMARSMKDEPLTGVWLVAGDQDGTGHISLTDLVIQARLYKTNAAAPLQSIDTPISITGPETSEVGQTITFRFDGSGDASAAAIDTKDLAIVSFSGGLSDETSLLMLESYGGLTATYTYRVTGPNPSFRLRNVVIAKDYVDYAGPDSLWTGRVSAGPGASASISPVAPGASADPSGIPSAAVTQSPEPSGSPSQGLGTAIPESSGSLSDTPGTATPHPTTTPGSSASQPSSTAQPSASPTVSLGSAVSGNLYVEDGALHGLSVGGRDYTSVSDLRSMLALPENVRVRVTTRDGKEMDGAQPVGTGCALALYRDGETAPYDTVTCVVQGDVLGTGRLGVSQLVAYAGHINGRRPLQGVYRQAGDFTNDGKVTLSDLVAAARLYSRQK